MTPREHAASYTENKNFESIASVLMDAENGLDAALFALEVYRALPTVEIRTAFLAELQS